MIPYRGGWAKSYWVFTVDQVLHRVLCQKPSHLNTTLSDKGVTFISFDKQESKGQPFSKCT